jgi:hypothetical protein
MPRLSQKRYELHVMITMAVYLVALLLVWPLARTVDNVTAKWLLALVPMLPMLYLIGLMARRIRDSDELEQRTHLIALGASTAVIGGLSLMGGFLAAAKVLVLDGTILIWVFPVVMMSYGVVRWWVSRGYGGASFCDDDHGIAMSHRLLIVAAMMAAVGLFAYFRRDAMATGVFLGLAATFTLTALIRTVVRRRHAARPEGRDED